MRAAVNDVSPNARRRALRGAHQLERKLLADMDNDPGVRLAVRPIRKSLASGVRNRLQILKIRAVRACVIDGLLTC